MYDTVVDDVRHTEEAPLLRRPVILGMMFEYWTMIGEAGGRQGLDELGNQL